MKGTLRGRLLGGFLAAGVVVAAGCGDPETVDERGYTKAPLEDPGLLIRGEPTTAMDLLGEPTYPVVRLIPPPAADTARGGAAEEG